MCLFDAVNRRSGVGVKLGGVDYISGSRRQIGWGNYLQQNENRPRNNIHYKVKEGQSMIKKNDKEKHIRNERLSQTPRPPSPSCPFRPSHLSPPPGARLRVFHQHPTPSHPSHRTRPSPKPIPCTLFHTNPPALQLTDVFSRLKPQPNTPHQPHPRHKPNHDPRL